MHVVLGDLEIRTVVVNRFALDGGAMFGVVPKTVWSEHFPADADNRIPLVARVMVVTNRRAGYLAVVDAGLGDAWSERERARYALEPGSLTDALAASGIAAETVTDLILTHLHWDHAGGIASAETATPTCVLPRARLHVGAAHLAYAERAAAKDRASFRPSELALARDARRLEPGEILPGIFATRSDGHTHGLLVIEARGQGGRVVFPADLIPTRAHVRPAWGMAYDNQPLTIVDEKRALIESCARDGAMVVLEHDPDIAAVTVRIEGERWTTEAVQETPSAHAPGSN